MGNDCSRLNETHNPCEISQCLDTIKGIAADNSRSPADKFVGLLKSGTHYKNEPISYVFLKVWINFPVMEENRALGYELCVQKYYIKKLVDKKICPFFIKFLAGRRNCRPENYFNLSKKAFLPGTSNEEIGQHIKRNLSFNVLPSGIEVARPPLEAPISEDDVLEEVQFEGQTYILDDWRNHTMGFIVTEWQPQATTLREWLLLSSTTANDMKNVFTQIAYACLCMGMVDMHHNDLHPSNILVETVEKPQVWKFTYNLEDYSAGQFKLKIDHMVKIFDFDRAITVRYGNNPVVQTPQQRTLNFDFCFLMIALVSVPMSINLAAEFNRFVTASVISDGLSAKGRNKILKTSAAVLAQQDAIFFERYFKPIDEILGDLIDSCPMISQRESQTFAVKPNPFD